MGLIYSWVISPVEYVDAPPYALRADFKDEYRALVAAAYLYSGDILRAEDRLVQLKDDNTSQSLALQAQRALEEGHPEGEVRALGILAMALGQGLTPMASGSPSTEVATISPGTGVIIPTQQLLLSTDIPALTPQPDLTQVGMEHPPASINTIQNTLPAPSTPTPGAPFILSETTLVCNPDQPQPMIQVVIQDAAGQPVTSVELVVTWENGEDHFFTGLQPELGNGYADFLMTPDVIYSLTLADGGQVVNDLAAAECLSEDQDHYWGSWMLTFVQP
jgi:hypothetical protein